MMYRLAQNTVDLVYLSPSTDLPNTKGYLLTNRAYLPINWKVSYRALAVCLFGLNDANLMLIMGTSNILGIFSLSWAYLTVMGTGYRSSVAQHRRGHGY